MGGSLEASGPPDHIMAAHVERVVGKSVKKSDSNMDVHVDRASGKSVEASVTNMAVEQSIIRVEKQVG